MTTPIQVPDQKNLVVYGDHDVGTLRQMERCLTEGRSAVRGVLCADGHLGYGHPIGGVVGYTHHVSISGVGFDIACGNMAVRLDVKRPQLRRSVGMILSDIAAAVSFGVGRNNEEQVDHDLFYSDLWEAAGVDDMRQMAQNQLGTVGSGNHYVDLFEDEDGWVWIGVHFGSRGLGHKTAQKYLRDAGAGDGMSSAPALLPVHSDLGAAYLAGMELCGLYAYAGREWVVERVRKIIGAKVTATVHNHHNFAWKETHDGVEMWVVRKGAAPAFPGQLGFVGGSMCDNGVILRGVESEESAAAMYSTVHGAGRVMSRTAAKGKRSPEARKVRRALKVDTRDWERQMAAEEDDDRQEWIVRPGVDRKGWERQLAAKGVTLVGGDVDEAPSVYRRLPDVLKAHAGTIEIVHQLKPFGVIMAGPGTRDPYKD